MNNTVTTSFLIAAGITLSACNVTTPTFSASENDQPDLAHYVARSDIAVNTVTASQQNVPQIANTARASASPARSSSGRAKGSSALQTAGFTQAASTGSRGQLSERGAGEQMSSPDKDGAAAEQASRDAANNRSSDKEANDPLPITTDPGKD